MFRIKRSPEWYVLCEFWRLRRKACNPSEALKNGISLAILKNGKVLKAVGFLL
jgi:hypothetical protein